MGYIKFYSYLNLNFWIITSQIYKYLFFRAYKDVKRPDTFTNPGHQIFTDIITSDLVLSQSNSKRCFTNHHCFSYIINPNYLVAFFQFWPIINIPLGHLIGLTVLTFIRTRQINKPSLRMIMHGLGEWPWLAMLVGSDGDYIGAGTYVDQVFSYQKG